MRIAWGTISALAAASMALFACTATQTGPRITVAAASSLQPLLDEILPLFEQDSGIHVDVTYSASGTIANQIEQGAPIDVFVSASLFYTDRLTQSGSLRSDSIVAWAEGQLVVVEPLEGANTRQGLRSAQRIAIANPEIAPYGTAAKQIIETAGLWDALEGRIVFAESVAQALQFAASGNVDFAFVAAALVDAAKQDVAISGIYFGTVDGGILTQSAGVTTAAHDQASAERLLSFLVDRQVAEVLQRHRYLPAHSIEPGELRS